VTRLRTWTPVVRFPAEAGIFLFATVSRPALGPTESPIQLIAGALSLEIMRPEHEVDHSPPCTAEVKIFIPPCHLQFMYWLNSWPDKAKFSDLYFDVFSTCRIAYKTHTHTSFCVCVRACLIQPVLCLIIEHIFTKLGIKVIHSQEINPELISWEDVGSENYWNVGDSTTVQ